MDEIKKHKIKQILIRIGLMILFVLFILGMVSLRKCRNLEEKTTIYNHLNDSTTYYKNKYGNEVARNTVLEASNVNTFLAIKSKDETIKWLQKEVKDNKAKIKDGGSISVIGTEVYFTGSNGTIVAFDTKPVKIGDTVYYYPTYKSNSKDTTWVDYNITANKDSTHVDFKVKNKYSVVIGETRDKWYKKKYPIVEVTNKNPYDKIKTLKAFEVKDSRSNRLGLGIGVGVGVTPKGIQPCFNIGLQYNFVKL